MFKRRNSIVSSIELSTLKDSVGSALEKADFFQYLEHQSYRNPQELKNRWSKYLKENLRDIKKNKIKTAFIEILIEVQLLKKFIRPNHQFDDYKLLIKIFPTHKLEIKEALSLHILSLCRFYGEITFYYSRVQEQYTDEFQIFLKYFTDENKTIDYWIQYLIDHPSILHKVIMNRGDGGYFSGLNKYMENFPDKAAELENAFSQGIVEMDSASFTRAYIIPDSFFLILSEKFPAKNEDFIIKVLSSCEAYYYLSRSQGTEYFIQKFPHHVLNILFNKELIDIGTHIRLQGLVDYDQNFYKSSEVFESADSVGRIEAIKEAIESTALTEESRKMFASFVKELFQFISKRKDIENIKETKLYKSLEKLNTRMNENCQVPKLADLCVNSMNMIANLSECLDITFFKKEQTKFVVLERGKEGEHKIVVTKGMHKFLSSKTDLFTKTDLEKLSLDLQNKDLQKKCS